MAQSASDVRAGGAFYELFGKDLLSGMFDKIQKRAAQFGTFLSKIGTKAGLAGAALSAPLTALFKGGLDRAADLARLNRQLGVPIEILNKMQYAADATGASLDEVMNSWDGRYSDLIARAPTINPNDAKAAAEMQLELADATRSVQLALLPLVRTVVIYVKMLSEWIQKNSGTAHDPRRRCKPGCAGVTLKVLGVVFAGLIPVASAAWAAVTGPIGLGVLIGAILGGSLFAGIAYLTDGFESLRKAGLDLGSTMRTVFAGIGDALAKGDIELAGKIAIKGLAVAWEELAHSATYVWIGMKMLWGRVVDSIAKAGNDVAHGLETAFVVAAIEIGNYMKWMARTVLESAITAAKAIDKLDPTSSLKGAIKFAESLRGELKDEDAGSARAELESRRKGIESIIDDDAKRREKELAGDALKADEDLRKKKDELKALRMKAAEPDKNKDKDKDKGPGLKPGLLGAISVKGSFSGAALGQSLGISDQAQKQTELMKQIRDYERDNPGRVAAALAPIVGAPPAVR